MADLILDDHGIEVIRKSGKRNDKGDITLRVEVVASLPAGDNNIGNVDIVSLPSANLDTKTNAVSTIVYGHLKVHSGEHYAVRNYAAVAKAGTRDVLMVTPNTTKWAHMVIGIKTSAAPIVVTLYEATTTSADGSLDGARNRNRNFADNNTTLIYNNPTVTNVGTLLYTYYIGTGKGVGDEARDVEEIVLKQNTKYLLRMVEQNLGATVVGWTMNWYEHTAL